MYSAVGNNELNLTELDKRVIQHEPLGGHDYTCLQMNAFVVISDSGTLPDYVEENVSTKVVKIIQSYTGVVNKMVWRKS